MYSVQRNIDAATVRWNSLNGLEKKDVVSQKPSYAYRTNKISLVVLKTCIVVIVTVYSIGSIGKDTGSYVLPLGWERSLLQLAGWICACAVGPLVLSAMILNARTMSVGSGEAEKKKEGVEAAPVGIAITPPARGVPDDTYKAMRRGSGYGASSLYTPPHEGGARDGMVQTTPSRKGHSPMLTRRATYSGGMTPPKTPLDDILHDFDTAAEEALNNARSTPTGSFMSMHHQTGLPEAMQQPLSHTYRPSAVQKDISKTIRSDGSVVSSQRTDRDRVLAELGIDDDILERSIETLREWIACRLLQPLEKRISAAYKNVINSAKSIGRDALINGLIDLNDCGVDTSSKLSDQRAPLENLLSQIRNERLHPSIGSNQAALGRYDTCIHAIITYKSILELLRGEFLHGTFLSSAPDGYILKRIKELANGTCMKDFLWNSGGESSSQRPWNNESPTDSALILYLFASFLAAPMWNFTDTQDQTRVEGPSDVLYLGKLPPRVSGKYTSILPKSLPEKSRGTAVQGIQLGTPNPHFSVSVEGILKLTETGQSGLFRILAIFLFYVNEDTGKLGNSSLKDLFLDPIVDKNTRFHFIDSLRKLHLW
jgi:hypothetical protein